MGERESWHHQNFPTEQFMPQQINIEKVLKAIKNTRNDCSSGFNNIPVSLIKPLSNTLYHL